MNLERFPAGSVYPRSATEVDGTGFALVRRDGAKLLVVQGNADGFQGEWEGEHCFCPMSPANATVLRQRLAWLRPQPLGVSKSAGCGDRLGLATPGHIRAFRRTGELAPIFAQQSMRENARTGRSPQQVLDDAMWGVFQEGWHEAWGADADHLKTTADIDLCVKAGYTFYTIDPGDHVDNEAHVAAKELLDSKVQSLPWDVLDDSPESLRGRYLSTQFELEEMELVFDDISLARAAAKYGGAIAHTAEMYRHLVARMGSRVFELEVSVDETETPTSPLEHYFVASELSRLGVQWVSLAPRYVGRFEKGVDYIGDLAEFDAALAQHAAISRALGPYKLSIHSGSDKFRVYPSFARHAGALVHLKTAGTSYLEALRALAEAEPDLFRSVLSYALERYAEDSATYHVSADPGKVPLPESLPTEQLAGVLDLFDGRQVLHVTFGSVVVRFGARLMAALEENEEVHYRALERHFIRHFEPFLRHKGV
jgi:hypothetical protein